MPEIRDPVVAAVQSDLCNPLTVAIATMHRVGVDDVRYRHGYFYVQGQIVSKEKVMKAIRNVQRLPSAGRHTTIGSPRPGASSVGRKRVRKPDPSTPSGQFALYLADLARDYNLDTLAKAAGISRATLFNYLSGESSPNLDALDGLAKALGLKDYRSMMPSDEFIRRLRRKS